jgi:hypothetical protein
MFRRPILGCGMLLNRLAAWSFTSEGDIMLLHAIKMFAYCSAKSFYLNVHNNGKFKIDEKLKL